MHFGRREGHAIELEITGFLHRTCGDRYMGNNGLADIGLPDTHHRRAVLRNARGIHQTTADRERAHRRRQVAAVTAPVHERLVDGDLTEQVIDVMVRAQAFADDYGLAGAGGGRAHAVDLFFVRIGAANHAQQQGITGCARHLSHGRQVQQAEEHALAGAATHIRCGNSDLRWVSHNTKSCKSRGTWPRRWG